MKRELIEGKRIYSYARRLERANFREGGESLSAGTIGRAADAYIEEVRGDSGLVLIREGWKEAMRKRAAE